GDAGVRRGEALDGIDAAFVAAEGRARQAEGADQCDDEGARDRGPGESGWVAGMGDCHGETPVWLLWVSCRGYFPSAHHHPGGGDVLHQAIAGIQVPVPVGGDPCRGEIQPRLVVALAGGELHPGWLVAGPVLLRVGAEAVEI